jgi:diguanylate cyclase (GGDEF)-like protein/PAS domain S-box-containing protein
MDQITAKEQARTDALWALGVLDTPAEPRFDRFTALASAALGAPISLISLIDHDRQWFKSRHGLAVAETPRSMAFCSYAVEGQGSFVVEDAWLDQRFAANPLVTGAPFIRFYAGHPIRTREGHAVGTLCVIDQVPRSLSATQMAMLRSLAGLVEAELNHEIVERARVAAETELRALNLALEGRVRERTMALEEKNDALNREIRQRADVEESLRTSVAAQIASARALEQKQELLDAVLETVDVAVVACDGEGNLSFFNRAAREIHGQEPGCIKTGAWARQFDLYQADGRTPLAPADVPLLRALAGDTVKDVPIVIAPAGMRARAVLASGRVLKSAAGERLGAMVAMNDVTDLQASEERLRTITDNVPVLISYIDNGLRYRFANAMYKEWLGVSTADMLGRTVAEVFGEDYYQERAASIAQAMRGNMSSVEVTVHRKGQARILNTTYMPHHREGKIAGVYVLATDATAARMHENKLLALANSDPLTGLPNRRMYEFHLEKTLATARRQQARLALMYLDLDDFKRINDQYGHATGDAVLLEFGGRVGALLRECDLLARLAGDEFTIVLDGVDSIAACDSVAAKIQAALETPFLFEGRLLRIGASIGVALGEPGVRLGTMSSRADEALYAAKRGGKGRCVVLEAR